MSAIYKAHPEGKRTMAELIRSVSKDAMRSRQQATICSFCRTRKVKKEHLLCTTCEETSFGDTSK